MSETMKVYLKQQANIQKAMSPMLDQQARVSEIVKAHLEQQATVQRAMKPFLDHQTRLNELSKAFLEQQASIQKAITPFLDQQVSVQKAMEPFLEEQSGLQRAMKPFWDQQKSVSETLEVFSKQSQKAIEVLKPFFEQKESPFQILKNLPEANESVVLLQNRFSPKTLEMFWHSQEVALKSWTSSNHKVYEHADLKERKHNSSKSVLSEILSSSQIEAIGGLLVKSTFGPNLVLVNRSSLPTKSNDHQDLPVWDNLQSDDFVDSYFAVMLSNQLDDRAMQSLTSDVNSTLTYAAELLYDKLGPRLAWLIPQLIIGIWINAVYAVLSAQLMICCPQLKQELAPVIYEVHFGSEIDVTKQNELH
jgi:hypothetical protein